MAAEEREALGRAALDWCLQYFDTMHALPVYPRTSAENLSALFSEDVPQEPQQLATVMTDVARLAEHSRHNGHPRMFGYVQSSATFTGAVADFLASALNSNVTSWRSAPAATTVERQATAWIASMIGLPPTTGGLFLSGGSMANFAALATALRSCTDADVEHFGVAALGREPRIYVSSMVHMSIPKAAGLL